MSINTVKIVALLVTAISSPILSSENKISLMQPAMLKLKDGIDQMVLSGKSLEQWSHNKAVLTYIDLQERFSERSPDILYQHILCSHERKKVDELWSSIADSDDYFNAYDRATNENSTQAWLEFKKTMSILAMKLLVEKGVKFQLNPSKDTHKEFLSINHDISAEAQQWLIPGSVMLYLPQQIEDYESSHLNN
jgi:hypothetical protein